MLLHTLASPLRSSIMRRVTPSLGTEHGCSHLCSEVTHWREVEHPPPRRGCCRSSKQRGSHLRKGLWPSWPGMKHGAQASKSPQAGRAPRQDGVCVRAAASLAPYSPGQSELTPVNLRCTVPAAPAPWATIDPCLGHRASTLPHKVQFFPSEKAPS